MKIYVISSYRERFPGLKGKELTEALIRLCAGKPEMIIRRTPEGKPVTDGMELSVSHSGSLFACVLGDSPVGIDLQHRRSVKTGKIAERYFTEEESRRVKTPDDFFGIWVRKEAYAKYTGEGLAQVIDKVDVLNREDVAFADMFIEDPGTGEECFCSVCTGAGEGIEAPEDIGIRYI